MSDKNIKRFNISKILTVYVMLLAININTQLKCTLNFNYRDFLLMKMRTRTSYPLMLRSLITLQTLITLIKAFIKTILIKILYLSSQFLHSPSFINIKLHRHPIILKQI